MSDAREKLRSFPERVRVRMGHALYLIQCGDTPHSAKPLRGFTGAGVLELSEDNVGDTYRAVYTVRFEDRVYVLHVFQKKSKQGIATPRRDLEAIQARLKLAELHYQADRAKERKA